MAHKRTVRIEYYAPRFSLPVLISAATSVHAACVAAQRRLLRGDCSKALIYQNGKWHVATLTTKGRTITLQAWVAGLVGSTAYGRPE